MTAIRVKNSGFVDLPKIDDGNDGNLIFMEAQRQIPFAIKRVYYINHVENNITVRGHHAHRSLWQVLFCIAGSFVLSLDDGEQTQEIHMFRDNRGVILGPRLWHTMKYFSTGAMLLVVASDYFDENDYIRNYDDFLAFLKETPEP